jgi:hypothetical protein
MERNELIRRMVLNDICDDYENVDQVIFPEVVETAARLGLTITRPEVVQALAELIERGLAKAYRLSRTEPIDYEGMPPMMDVVEEDFATYFFRTKEGLELILSDDSWRPLGDLEIG